MKIPAIDTTGFNDILTRKVSELARVLRNRDDIAIQKSADPMDEIQYATERDLAIQNVGRDSILLGQVKAALQRIRDGSFGACIQCEEAINPKRLAAVPWASRCILCQETADRNRQEESESSDNALISAA